MSEIEEIDLSNITIRKNAHIRRNPEGIEDLMLSIKTHGLLQPIIVSKNADGRYELLAGERRLIAIDKLGWKKIRSMIVTPKDEYEAKSISLASSLTRVPLSTRDIVDTCTELYNQYNDVQIVAKKFGISVNLVKKYVKFSRLPDILKDAVRNGDLGKNPKKAMNIALEAVDALNWERSGNIPEEKVLKLAKALAEVRPIHHPRFPERNRFIIYLSNELSEKVKKVADKYALIPEDELTDLFLEFLEEKLLKK